MSAPFVHAPEETRRRRVKEGTQGAAFRKGQRQTTATPGRALIAAGQLVVVVKRSGDIPPTFSETIPRYYCQLPNRSNDDDDNTVTVEARRGPREEHVHLVAGVPRNA
uniref:Uncharacterized protein n=1 Tax=Anopheles albimanus TaxID=7167 RepID=A0A182FYW7_ANOAL